MLRKDRALVAGAILAVIILTDFGLFMSSAISQENVSQERTLCIENCKYLYAGLYRDLWRLYFNCLEDCEKKMWKQWDKDMEELEKE